MNNEKKMNSLYLSISYKTLVNNIVVHHILFLVEVLIIFLQIIEIYYNDFKSYKEEKIMIFNPLNLILKLIIKLPNYILFIIYLIIIIIIIIINFYILNTFRITINFYIKIITNINELLLFRVLSLFMFNYLFLFTNMYLFVNIIITIPYIILLLFYFSNNYIFLFFPSLINYPYDSFSMIIDLNLLVIKICISISSSTSNKNISKFFFIICLFTLFFLLIYLSIIIKNKSYYLMNNCNLNKFRYTIILNSFILIFLIIFFDKRNLFNIYYKISYFNILILSLLFIFYFYDPYKYSKFDKDNNIENVYYYLFILDGVKNNYLLLEEKIEEHLAICNRCNLCKKYNMFKNNNKNDEFDYYYIIYNGEDLALNLMNSLAQKIKKHGKSIFFNNSHYLINLIYIYCIGIKKRDYNYISNSELLFDFINSENTQFLEEYKISLNQIKYSSDFLIKSKNIIQNIYEILDEKNRKIKVFDLLKLAEKIDKLQIKEIQNNINSNRNYNYNIEGLPNCNNLLTICSLFYEELCNESISNSSFYIKDNPNLIEDLINHNNKNINQITFEIDIQNFNVKIIRAGGHMNKYENNSLFDCFPSIFKKKQIIEMKNLLLNSKDNFQIEKRDKRYSKRNNKKYNKNQNINFTFIIEEKENKFIFNRLLKLKLSLILLPNIKIKIYLNGKYSLIDNIIVTKEQKEEEIVLHFGRKDQMTKIKKNKNSNLLIIKNTNNTKFLGNNKLVEYMNFFIGYNKYNIYQILSSSKKNIFENIEKNIQAKDNIDEEKNNLYSDKKFIFNEMASQASSTTTSLSKNILLSYYKGNKKSQKDEDIAQKFNITKYTLLFSIIGFCIFIIFQIIYLILFYKEVCEKNNYYLLLKDYSNNYNILFLSILSLICLAESIDSYYCINKMNEVTNNLNYNQSIDFVNLTDILLIQNEILIENLESKLDILNKYLALYNEKTFINKIKINISYYKINQIFKNNEFYLSLTKENLIYSDFIKLMTSRFKTVLNDYNFLNSPIYILNKTGNEVFNNVLIRQRLDSSQENIYLIILDSKSFMDHFEIVTADISTNISKLKLKLKYLIYFFINLDMFFLIIIIISLVLYLGINMLIIVKIINDININMKQKIGNNTIKDILRRKIDNLKLLLKFYENDINIIIKDLNNIYNDYRDNYNLKMKEESKLLKKEENEGKKNKIINCSSIIRIFKNFNLFKYSKRRKRYVYSLLFIIILTSFLYIITIIIWSFYLQKDDKVFSWVRSCTHTLRATSNLMNNFILMIYNNQTLNEISETVDSKDFVSYIYTELTDFYQGEKYFHSLSDTITIKDQNINYDCELFYRKLENELFEKLKKRFINQEEKLYNTMIHFCQQTNIMMIKNYKSIYLQLFSKIKNLMETFKNTNYKDIIKYIHENSIDKVEITFLIIYTYFVDFLSTNFKITIASMEKQLKDKIIITAIIFIILLLCIVFLTNFIYIKNVNKECKKFIQIRKIFKVCNINE